MNKKKNYVSLVQKRKNCRNCINNKKVSLLNLSDDNNDISWLNKDGKYNSNHLSPWSGWQGNLDSNLIVIGNDWASSEFLRRNKSSYANTICKKDKTNKKIVEYVNKYIGKKISLPSNTCTNNEIFMTQAVLCIKDKDKRSGKHSEHTKTCSWECFQNCSEFLQETIELIFPKNSTDKKGAVVTLGSPSTLSILNIYFHDISSDWRDFFNKIEINLDKLPIKREKLNKIIDRSNEKGGIKLYDKIRFFPVAHPAFDVLNRGYINGDLNYNLGKTKVGNDWKCIGDYLNF